ncbi:MAG: LD-carboxypeptidase [Bacteroidia bacterium]|nr:LD-carboxypeptidase [Bacteroidia bacterium]
MNRKKFIAAASLFAIPGLSGAKISPEEDDAPVIPRYLDKGDAIGIVATGGYILAEEIQPAVQVMESWGYRIQIGNTIGKRDYTFGGSDEERIKDFQQMLDDAKVKAIMCARGGYGLVRIIDKLSFTLLQQRPKWIIGFSDITVLHSHLNSIHGIATIHSKMCNSFPEDWDKAEPIQQETILSIRDALAGKKMNYETAPDEKNRPGTAEGILVGGNLKTIESLNGTKSDLKTAGRILFVEDTGEYLYSIDRMFWGLKRTGKLSQLKGLILGGFKIKPDEAGEEFGRSLYDIVLEKVKEYKYPVCFNFPAGHQKNNFALKCGVRHRLVITKDSIVLNEI